MLPLTHPLKLSRCGLALLKYLHEFDFAPSFLPPFPPHSPRLYKPFEAAGGDGLPLKTSGVQQYLFSAGPSSSN